MSESWHADDELLALYVRGGAGPLRGASLEQHLTRCADCRARIGTHVDSEPLELVWDRIREQAQAPEPTTLERLLTRYGASEPDALLVAVAPSLRASWLFGMAVTLGFVCLAAGFGGDRGVAFFLIVAPLIPVAGVAFAYGPDVDPSYEVGAAVPYSAARLLLLRSAAVLATSVPLVLAGALLVPGLSWAAVAWLFPALTFTAILLAASTWVRPSVAGFGLGVCWTVAVGAGLAGQDPAAVLTPALLAVYTGFGVAAALVFRLRLRHLTLLGSPS
jgi:Putative zinc-finger